MKKLLERLRGKKEVGKLEREAERMKTLREQTQIQIDKILDANCSGIEGELIGFDR